MRAVPKSVAVTGAAGVVGRAVVAHLEARGHRVIPIDHAGPRPIDVTSYEQTLGALRDADSVVHLAAINRPGVEDAFHINVVAARNVRDACIELGIPRLVEASSINAIGAAFSAQPRFDYFPIDLAHPARPEDDYSRSKRHMEEESRAAVAEHPGLSIVSLRLHSLMPDAAAARQQQTRSGDHWAIKGLFGYCTPESVANAFELALTADLSGHEVLFVVEPATFAEAPTRVLARQYYPEVPWRRAPRGHRSFFDTTRTEEVLGWRASTARRWPWHP